MHVVKKEFMYVLKPFGGEGGGGFAKGDKIRVGCLTPAFWGAHKWAEMLRHPCILGDPQTKGDKIRTGCPTLPSEGPTSGRKCYVTPTLSMIPNKGDKIKAQKKHKKKIFPWCP